MISRPGLSVGQYVEYSVLSIECNLTRLVVGDWNYTTLPNHQEEQNDTCGNRGDRKSFFNINRFIMYNIWDVFNQDRFRLRIQNKKGQSLSLLAF